ncbi:hypothetical protein [Sporolactobacillus pectinivorans]|uniref:hypothetical protein n=1 Tax=Sporolactobacillus pectinivorans TaxID=1591408 RepID=UPI00187526E7|nr:hypothetical protein [Sporolactobacillus pectinivorans]
MTEKVWIGNTGLFVNPIGLGINAVSGHTLSADLIEKTASASNHGQKLLFFGRIEAVCSAEILIHY